MDETVCGVQSHGLMGWRVGYIAYPDFDADDALGLQLVKVQDTVPIHSAIMSQNIALGSLLKGKPYLDERLKSLEANRQALFAPLPVANVAMSVTRFGLKSWDHVSVAMSLPSSGPSSQKLTAAQYVRMRALCKGLWLLIWREVLFNGITYLLFFKAAPFRHDNSSFCKVRVDSSSRQVVS
jgi:hypothetical protein